MLLEYYMEVEVLNKVENLQLKEEVQSRQLKQSFYKTFKRLFDILFSISILILLSFFLIVIALWIIITDGLPVFFKQRRSGLNDNILLIFKFRSMKNKQVPVASNKHNYDNWSSGVPDDFVFKSSGEINPNITTVGRFIRKYSIDEFPQFINVLKGDMSIIGPRPEILAITDKYSDHQRRRLEVKPGITGWAQVNGRSEMNHGDKIKYDLYYVENQSLGLDFKIFYKTIGQVIVGRGSV